MNKVWTKKDKQTIKDRARNTKDADLAKLLAAQTGRKVSTQAVRKQRTKLGIKKKKGRGMCGTYEYCDTQLIYSQNDINSICIEKIKIDKNPKLKSTWSCWQIDFLKRNYLRLSDKEIGDKIGKTKSTVLEKRLFNLRLLKSSGGGNRKIKIKKELTKDEVQYIVDNYQTLSDKEIGQNLNIPVSYVSKKRYELKLYHNNWKSYEINYLYLHSKLKDITIRQVTQVLDRTLGSVKHKASKLNLKFIHYKLGICKQCGEYKTLSLIDKTICGKCRTKNKKQQDPNYRLRHLLSKSLRKAMKGKKQEPTFNILNYTKKEFLVHLQSYIGKPCEYCNNGIITIENSHMDHIVPVSISDETGESSGFPILVVNLFSLDNLRLIHAKCNMSKHNRMEF